MIHKIPAMVALLAFLSPFSTYAEFENHSEQPLAIEDNVHEVLDPIADHHNTSEMMDDEEIETNTSWSDEDEPEMPAMH